jgi:hypothetical protein
MICPVLHELDSPVGRRRFTQICAIVMASISGRRRSFGANASSTAISAMHQGNEKNRLIDACE